MPPTDLDVALRSLLVNGPLRPSQLIEQLGISQPTLSRALTRMGAEVLRWGAARSIQYALRDETRGLGEISVHRVDGQGRLSQLGVLVPVRPSGFLMRQEDGVCLHSDGLPWWLYDMRPQGFLGRAWAARHGPGLGLPVRLTDWSDAHCLRALLAEGHDVVGNLLLGEEAKTRFLSAPPPEPISMEEKGLRYPLLARAAAQGELPGSSAGGEQPKFTVCAETPGGARHLIVKFSEVATGPVGERWRDLLLAEHLALNTLRETGIAAAVSHLLDFDEQRFLEVERFDRVGLAGRRALFSLSALDAEFVGQGSGGWPAIVRRLVDGGHVRPEALADAGLLWAFGTLIGNTDMHNGNLSFLSDQGHPYELAPAYDMVPMAFAPRTGGGLPAMVPAPRIDGMVDNETWRRALALALRYLTRLESCTELSESFSPCVAAMRNHMNEADRQIGKLA